MPLRMGASRIRAGRKLGRAERLLLLRAYAYLLWVDGLLRLLGFKWFVRSGGTPLTSPARDLGTPDAIRRARQYAFWLEVAARHHVVRARCLHRSLALRLWLQRDGIASDLRIGVGKAGCELKAHAWVAVAGTVVNDAAEVEQAFVRLSDIERFTSLAPRGRMLWSA